MDPLHIHKNFSDHPSYFLLALPVIIFLLLLAIFIKFEFGSKVLGVSTSNLDSSTRAEENR